MDARPLFNPQMLTPAQDSYALGHRSDFYVNLSCSQGEWYQVRRPYGSVSDPTVWQSQRSALNADAVLNADVNGANQRARQVWLTPIRSQQTTPASGTGVLMSDYKRQELGWKYNYTGQKAQSVLTMTDAEVAKLTSGHADPTKTWQKR